MLFHSQEFIFIFLPMVLIIYFLIKKFTTISTKYVLILSGIIFYSYWNFILTPIIIISILVNFYFSTQILNSISTNIKKINLIYSILFNTIYLIILKYTDFIILNLNSIFTLEIPMTNFPFPLALSFVTFQSINFLVNCYDGVINKIKFKNYFLFIIFFPQLIAGPIVQYDKMMPQFSENKKIDTLKKYILIGLVIFLIGMFKKVFIGDNLSILVEPIFNSNNSLNPLDAWIGSIAFTMQIYFDFSGYIDMATGIALLFGINLPVNFDSPYKSRSIIEFWQRWHITLSNFLMNFVYFPMLRALKKITFFKSMFLILVTFLIAGLWHGPSWNYIIFGALHGFGLILNHIYRKYIKFKLNKIFLIFITFNFVNLSFIFFRSESIKDAIFMINSMFNLTKINTIQLISLEYHFSILILIISLLIIFGFNNTNYLIRKFKKND